MIAKSLSVSAIAFLLTSTFTLGELWHRSPCSWESPSVLNSPYARLLPPLADLAWTKIPSNHVLLSVVDIVTSRQIKHGCKTTKHSFSDLSSWRRAKQRKLGNGIRSYRSPRNVNPWRVPASSQLRHSYVQINAPSTELVKIQMCLINFFASLPLI